MNYAAKHSAMSAKPNQSLSTAANAMNSHDDIKARGQRDNLWRSSTEQPLYVQEDSNGGHNVRGCLSKLRPVATSLIIQQFAEKDEYVFVRLSEFKFLAIRGSLTTRQSTCEGCPPSFKGRPKFREAHVIEAVHLPDENIVLVCSCGYKQRYGLVCRHLFGLEPNYSLDDFACRWQTRYALYAFEDGCEAITQAYQSVMNYEHDGIRLKSTSLVGDVDELLVLPMLMPCSSTNIKMTVEEALGIYNCTVPVCWNYSLNEYPSNMNTNSQFTQESSQVDFEPRVDAAENMSLVVYGAADITQITTRTSKSQLNGMILQKVKDMLPLCTTAEAQQRLLAALCSVEKDMYAEVTAEMTKSQRSALLGATDDDVSFGLPIDTDKKSTQHTYKRRKQHR
jgi:hypothetical protein